MLFCGVSGVDIPAIAGVLLRQIHHDAVTRHLGDDRGHGDAQRAGVALDHAGVRIREMLQVQAIDEDARGDLGLELETSVKQH